MFVGGKINAKKDILTKTENLKGEGNTEFEVLLCYLE